MFLHTYVHIVIAVRMTHASCINIIIHRHTRTHTRTRTHTHTPLP